MLMKTATGRRGSSWIAKCIMAVMISILFLSSGDDVKNSAASLIDIRPLVPFEQKVRILEAEERKYAVQTKDEGNIVSYASRDHYRYGPSIIENEDGSYDMWLSSPGNNSTQWDYITYRHSDDGSVWSKEKIVLRPTANSRDRCSVCDPGVIYFNGYYYLGYTSTSDYSRNGYNNSAFVARSKDPEGPYEKWDGEGWGGKPQPIIEYEGDPRGWGIGEVSFVVLEEELYIYYTYFDKTGGYTGLAIADLSEDWPSSIRNEGMVLPRSTQDSIDVFYADDEDLFMAFSIENRMSQSSKIALYVSENGKIFTKHDATKEDVEPYSHNIGIAKGKDGHQSSDKDLLCGYAYGRRWGRWNAKVQYLNISDQTTYKVVTK